MTADPHPRLRQTAREMRESQAAAIHEAPIDGQTWRTWAIMLAVSAAAGVFLSAVGAFNTDQVPLGMRLVVWVPGMTIACVIAIGVLTALERFGPLSKQPLLYYSVGALAVSGPITLWIWAYDALLFGNGFEIGALPLLFTRVAIITVPMLAIACLVDRPGAVTHAAPDAVAQARFLDRLPPKLKGGALYAVQAEDHYLRLHTSKGSDLILMRLADAITELEGLEGAQTHRSWWVARDAVESVKRSGDRITLALKGGAEAPVSRPNLRPLRESGWL